MTERTPLRQGSLDKLAQDVAEIISQVAEIERLTGLVGTTRDAAGVRRELKARRDKAVALTSDVSKTIKLEARVSGRNKQEQQRYEKLVQQFSAAAQRCHEVSKQSLYKENQFAGDFAVEESHSINNRQEGGGWGGSTQRLVEKREISIDRSIVEETNQEFRALNGELGALKEAYEDVAELLAEQGIVLDKTEDNVTHADVNTAKAVDNLTDALEYQQSARKKIVVIAICLLLTLLLVLGGVGGFLAYQFTK